MNKQDQMTMQEAERKMESLREVFQVVRLVDGKMLMDAPIDDSHFTFRQ